MSESHSALSKFRSSANRGQGSENLASSSSKRARKADKRFGASRTLREETITGENMAPLHWTLLSGTFKQARSRKVCLSSLLFDGFTFQAPGFKLSLASSK